MPDLIPVEHDPFDERWNALSERSPFDVAAQRTQQGVRPIGGRQEGRFTRALAGFIPEVGSIVGERAEQLYDLYKTPGDILAGKSMRQPTAPGMWSDEDEAVQQLNNAEAVRRANAMSLDAMWAASPFAKPGAVGSGGGKIIQPQPEIVAPATGIRAYHGSPYHFDRFDMSKIGTGEGAQVYGHGLYFAGNEATALTYKNAPRVTDMDWPVSGTDLTVPAWVARSSRTHQGLDEVRANFAGRLKESERELAAGDWNAQTRIYHQQRTLDALDAIKGGAELKQPGRMYEVNINAKPEQFLDWDRPLAQQSEQARKAFESARIQEMYHASIDPIKGDPHMPLPTAYERLAEKLGGDAGASNALREAGVPGIKYLDQGSRGTSGGQLVGVEKGAEGWQAKIKVGNRGGAGFQSPTDMFTTSRPFATEAEAKKWADSQINSGTSNYVLFDDKIIDILRKYGIGGIATLPPAVASQLSGHLVPVDHDPFADQSTQQRHLVPVEHDPFAAATYH